jgi:hypothetical protein
MFSSLKVIKLQCQKLILDLLVYSQYSDSPKNRYFGAILKTTSCVSFERSDSPQDRYFGAVPKTTNCLSLEDLVTFFGKSAKPFQRLVKRYNIKYSFPLFFEYEIWSNITTGCKPVHTWQSGHVCAGQNRSGLHIHHRGEYLVIHPLSLRQKNASIRQTLQVYGENHNPSMTRYCMLNVGDAQ